MNTVTSLPQGAEGGSLDVITDPGSENLAVEQFSEIVEQLLPEEIPQAVADAKMNRIRELVSGYCAEGGDETLPTEEQMSQFLGDLRKGMNPLHFYVEGESRVQQRTLTFQDNTKLKSDQVLAAILAKIQRGTALSQAEASVANIAIAKVYGNSISLKDIHGIKVEKSPTLSRVREKIASIRESATSAGQSIKQGFGGTKKSLREKISAVTRRGSLSDIPSQQVESAEDADMSQDNTESTARPEGRRLKGRRGLMAGLVVVAASLSASYVLGGDSVDERPDQAVAAAATGAEEIADAAGLNPDHPAVTAAETGAEEIADAAGLNPDHQAVTAAETGAEKIVDAAGLVEVADTPEQQENITKWDENMGKINSHSGNLSFQASKQGSLLAIDGEGKEIAALPPLDSLAPDQTVDKFAEMYDAIVAHSDLETVYDLANFFSLSPEQMKEFGEFLATGDEDKIAELESVFNGDKEYVVGSLGSLSVLGGNFDHVAKYLVEGIFAISPGDSELRRYVAYEVRREYLSPDGVTGSPYSDKFSSAQIEAIKDLAQSALLIEESPSDTQKEAPKPTISAAEASEDQDSDSDSFEDRAPTSVEQPSTQQNAKDGESADGEINSTTPEFPVEAAVGLGAFALLSAGAGAELTRRERKKEREANLERQLRLPEGKSLRQIQEVIGFDTDNENARWEGHREIGHITGSQGVAFYLPEQEFGELPIYYVEILPDDMVEIAFEGNKVATQSIKGSKVWPILKAFKGSELKPTNTDDGTATAEIEIYNRGVHINNALRLYMRYLEEVNRNPVNQDGTN